MTGLGRRFGSLNVHEFVGAVADYPEIIDVRKEAEDHGSNFGGAWHSDVTYLEQPALGSILYAREVPDFGVIHCLPICTWPTTHYPTA